MSTDIFDFGFTAVNEEELKSVQQNAERANDAEQSVTVTQDKLDKLYNAVQPLLNNLKANPEKDYIYWPNRTVKVEQFEDLIQGIYNGPQNKG
tara:strand:- start:341 stop:619 length:279 start_codon:yes stop_codon:yes gene_type:complete